MLDSYEDKYVVALSPLVFFTDIIATVSKIPHINASPMST